MLRVALVCVGRSKPGAERDLAQRYLERAKAAGRSIGFAVESREIEDSRSRRAEDRKTEEAAAIRQAAGDACRLLLLEESGDAIDSAGFAALLGAARDAGLGSIGIVVGGPDGMSSALRDVAYRRIAFGAMTWPHQLVRIMASEQLYRAVTILSGHPYHRP